MNKTEQLRESCDKVIDFQYLKKFSTEEVNEFKTQLSVVMIESSEIEEEFDAIKTEYKAKLKPLKDKVHGLLRFIRDKARLVKEECYVNYEGEYAIIYNSDGEEIDKRPLTVDERQKTIFMETRKAQ